MLKVVIVCIKEQLACVELSDDTRHRPDVTLLVPASVFQDDFRGTVLPRVDNQGVAFMRICRSSEVNHLYVALQRLEPGRGLLPRWQLLVDCWLLGLFLSRKEACATATAFLAPENTPLSLHLLNESQLQMLYLR